MKTNPTPNSPIALCDFDILNLTVINNNYYYC